GPHHAVRLQTRERSRPRRALHAPAADSRRLDARPLRRRHRWRTRPRRARL
ncbi:MAG: hypothetical protein AVDCRST_MAG67-2579, partial [uncultured Solirubrobacteraceae bacterium]